MLPLEVLPLTHGALFFTAAEEALAAPPWLRPPHHDVIPPVHHSRGKGQLFLQHHQLHAVGEVGNIGHRELKHKRGSQRQQRRVAWHG
jgi:hypothetical protein